MYRHTKQFSHSNYIALIAIIISALPYNTYTQLQFHHQEEILKRQKQNLNFHLDPHHHISHFGFISNLTLTGKETGCKFFTKYEVTSIVNYQMCVGQNTIDLKNGMSIIRLIQSRGYLPTCRILHLLLWMQSEVSASPSKKSNRRDHFIDIGANIGSCTTHIAALGYPVISAEPVTEHIKTIQGTIDSYPSFHIDLHQVGVSSVQKSINVSYGHGAKNWGATIFEEDEKSSQQLNLITMDQLVGPRRVSLVKIDCEGCEWSALIGGKRTLHKTPMLKIELVQPKYTDGNTTATPSEVIKYLCENGFEIFKDHWLENHLYFGKEDGKVIEIDKIFGNSKVNVPLDYNFLELSAKKILSDQITPENFDSRQFQKVYTDIIAIEKNLAEKLRSRFLK